MKLLVVDLEGTCCEDGSIPPPERETIEIGAVLVDLESGAVESEFSELVRPIRHPTLSAFCMELTGISQADADSAKTFPEVWDWFLRWVGGTDSFGSWGTYDLEQLKRDCGFRGLPLHFGRHCNIARVYHPRERCGKSRAMRQYGIAKEGRNHRGLDDARKIAKVAVAMAKAGKDFKFERCI